MVFRTIIQETVTLWDGVLYAVGGCLGTDTKPPKHRRHEDDSDFDKGARARRVSDTKRHDHDDGKKMSEARIQPLDFDPRPVSTRQNGGGRKHLVIHERGRSSGERRLSDALWSEEGGGSLKYLQDNDETPGGWRREHNFDQRRGTLAYTGESRESKAARKQRKRESRAVNGNGGWMGE